MLSAVPIAVGVSLLLPGPSLASATFEADCAALATGPHRLAGTAWGRAAALYVGERLQETGADHVLVQEFTTTQTRIERCRLTVGDPEDPDRRVLDLLPMRPNGVIPPVTPPEGITGPIVHFGSGPDDDVPERHIEGAIAVLDYNAGSHWLRAFRLGAKAVLFVERAEARARHPHYVDGNANLLRFYYPGNAADLPQGETATLHSEVIWEPVVAHNNFAFFRGTDPVFSRDKEEMIVVAARLDSFGEVAHLSPGARGAANCAGLLKLAEYLNHRRPRRHILLAFFDAQARGYAGANAFYRALEPKQKTGATVAPRRRFLEKENASVARIRKLLATDNPLIRSVDLPRDIRQRCLQYLVDNARRRKFTVDAQMKALRQELQELRQRTNESATKDADLRERVVEIEKLLTDVCQPEKDRWNDVRRTLGAARRIGGPNIRMEPLPGEVRAGLVAVIDGVTSDMAVYAHELELEDRALASDEALEELLGQYRTVLHISLLLGDASPWWGPVIGGDSSFRPRWDNPLLYGKVQSAFLNAWRGLKENGGAPAHFLEDSVDGSLVPNRTMWAAPLYHGGAVAGVCGIYNVALGTCQERLPREGTPADTLVNLNLERIESQVDEFGHLLTGIADLHVKVQSLKEAQAALADQDALSSRRGIQVTSRYRVTQSGPMLMGILPGSVVPSDPVPGGMVQIRSRLPPTGAFEHAKPYAFDDFFLVRSNQSGRYGMGPLHGKVGFAAVFDRRGMVEQVSCQASELEALNRLNVFRCRPGVVVHPLSPRTWGGDSVTILDAGTNARLPSKKSFVRTADGMTYWYADRATVEEVKLFNRRKMVGLNNGPLEHGDPGRFESGDLEAEENYLGIGFSMVPGFPSLRSTERSAADLWRLNEARLRQFRREGVHDHALEELHARAEDLLLEAREAKGSRPREALAGCSFLASQPVYRGIRALVDDLVLAVVILLGLSVPFAVVMERVTICAATIYRQLLGMAVFFVLTFLVLYFSHPAFGIAGSPIIIFLGFAILSLAILVICIMLQRFGSELKALQGMSLTLHSADISRIGTMLAAVQMGISTMRRRPLRTAITALTVILLTFAILFFAAFDTRIGILRVPGGERPAYSGAWVRNPNWTPLALDIAELIRGRWGDRANVCRRWWVSPSDPMTPGVLVTRKDGSQPILLRGILGLSAAEVKARPDLAGLLGGEVGGKVLLTRAVSARLGVDPGERVLLNGVLLEVGEMLDAVALAAAEDMDGRSILPVDFTVKTGEPRQQAQPVEETIDPSSLTARTWSRLPADSVAIVSGATAAELGASLYAIAVYTSEAGEAGEIADDLARILPMPITATRPDRLYVHLLGRMIAVTGEKDLIFPILLGGLVIFGTMLGSVSDRAGEIYTFSALGLAPRHITTLFLAESLVYSLIGGMGGYLLAQGTAKALSALATYTPIPVPEMNMSSTNTVVTVLIVMGIVLVSAIYPAVKASRSANPGLMRRWQPPAPNGDVLDLVFPFTVSAYDVTGVISFLKEHFEAHRDTGFGRFVAGDVRLVTETNGEPGLYAHVRVAPFELGVSQDFLLRSAPSEIDGIDEVKVRLQRTSGQPKDWQRLYKSFLDDLRQQFLIWRSLPAETMDLYRQRALTEQGSLVELDAQYDTVPRGKL